MKKFISFHLISTALQNRKAIILIRFQAKVASGLKLTGHMFFKNNINTYTVEVNRKKLILTSTIS